ncbi:D-sedoheptulose 7-phosphate isomerase [Halomonas kenyensis]|uniref:Phosphoheptose isomerase n=2 Tax=Billgrantia kenyensis TaxID=321266 RepID=A0A7W0AE57_9GAMM|nr:D-sedoheptulose 7-phosphate isomerase [Halomonas kenyensis]MCG6662533.1 D-sedoheptulose 7-phosphate isomerase [Halomonas kenyensis]
MEQHIYHSLSEARAALDALLKDKKTLRTIAAAGQQLSDTFRRGGRVFSCGNGGSMCDAMHFAEELSGRYRLHRKGLPAAAISDPSHLSCVGNDYGYDRVFARYLEAHGREDDCLLAISTSGTSANVLAAAEHAKRHGIHVIALTGRKGSVLGDLADIELCTPAGQYADRVQELHIKVIHILIELVERELFPENY